MKVYWQKSAHLEVLRVKYRMLQRWNIDVFDRATFLWGHSGSRAPGIRGWEQRVRRPIEDYLRHRQRLSAYRLGPSDLDEHLAKLQRFAPKSLYGYSNAVSLLARRALQRGIKIPSLELAILTAEPVDRASLEVTASAFDCDAVIEYGSVECGVMATSDVDGKLRIRDDQVILESVPNQLGRYDLVVTVLGNPAFPLMRYCIEDITSDPVQKPKFGFSILHGVDGRSNDMLVATSGRVVHSLAVKHVLENFTAVRRFRAHQFASGDLEVLIEKEPDLELPQDALKQTFVQLLEGYPARIKVIDRIPRTLAGKHRFISSDLIGRNVDDDRRRGDFTNPPLKES